MQNKKHISTSGSLPGFNRPGRSPECAAQRCTTESKPTSFMTPAMVVDSVFNKNSFTRQEQQIIQMTIDQHTSMNNVALWRPERQGTEKLPDFITEAIENNKPIESEKLQALRKFTTEILDLQHWVTEKMINEYLLAGYSKKSIMELETLARQVMNNQQRRDKPCVLLELPCVNPDNSKRLS